MDLLKSPWWRRKFEQLPQIIIFDLRAICWPALVIPFAVWALTAWGTCRFVPKGTPQHQEWMDFWDFTAGVWVTGGACGLALLRFLIQRKWYWLWLSVLAGLLFCRELHFEGSNILVHAGIVAAFAVAWLAYEKMAAYFTSRWVVTLIVMLFTFYTITQTLDQRWWQFLPYEDDWEKATEECLEVMGHLVLLSLAVFSRPRKASPEVKPVIPDVLRG